MFDLRPPHCCSSTVGEPGHSSQTVCFGFLDLNSEKKN